MLIRRRKLFKTLKGKASMRFSPLDICIWKVEKLMKLH